jgi:hypothetical protein
MIREVREPKKTSYIVYDHRGYIVVITTERGVAEIYERRVSLSNAGKR